jgi:hypothetical protein
MHTAAKYGLIAMFFAGMATCVWANSRMIKRVQQASGRTLFMNPKYQLAVFQGREWIIFIAALLVLFAAVMGFKALK